MKIIQIFVIFLLSTLLTSCFYPYEGEGGWQEDWIATINLTGDSLNYITKDYLGGVQFIPNTTTILINRGAAGIWTMNIDGTNIKCINDSAKTGYEIPCISSDGTKMVFGDGDIYRMDIDGTNLQNITNTPEVRDRYPHFFPNGDSIVYATESDSLITISIIDKDGENSRTIISNTPTSKLVQRYCYPRFNKGGDKIYYKFIVENGGLYSINTDGTNNTILYEGYLESYFLSMPTDGSKIVFSCNSHIYIMNIDGYGILDLGRGRSAMISGNGLKIVFDGIGIMNSDGSNIIEPARGSNPVFSSNGEKIVFIAEREFPED